MTDPKRYDCYILGGNSIDDPAKPDGEFVRWEDYARLKAEVEQLTTWQPIETAPRDGTAILGCCGWEIEVTAFQKGTERYQRKEAWVVANDDEGYAQDFKPTHWLPLPNRNPPIKRTKSQK